MTTPCHYAYLLACHQLAYIKPKLLTAHLGQFPSWKSFAKTSNIEMHTQDNIITPTLIGNLLESRSISYALEWLQDPNHHLITIHDAPYPSLLKEISDPPPILFVAGDISLLSTHQIAVVGSRKPTPYGQAQANRLVGQLADLGLTITSGLACGVDTFAHQCTLQHQGKTIGVIGNGLDIIYPKSNRKLYQTMIEQGCIISEYPLGTAPAAMHFPRRNRLISGLSLATLVIEARIKSGSLITAKLALQQNRDVFALPGPIYSQESEGCHYLIKSGAKLVDHCADIIVELPSWLNIAGKAPIYKCKANKSQALLATLSQSATRLIQQLSYIGPMSEEDCLVACGFSAPDFAQAKLECELLALISYAKGRYWVTQ